MNKKIISSLLLLIGIFSFAKLKSQDLNLSFESENLKRWYIFGQSANYEIIPDSENKIKGNKSLLIKKLQPSRGFAGVRQRLPKNRLRRIRTSAPSTHSRSVGRREREAGEKRRH